LVFRNLIVTSSVSIVMSHLPRAFQSFLLAAMGCGILLTTTSCTSPATDSASASGRQYVGPSNMRHRYGGYPTRSSNPPIVVTTRDNFFTWLFALDDASPAKSKKATKPVGPVVPAHKVNTSVLARSNKSNTRVVVDIARQKAFLLVGGEVAIETPVSTARPGKFTPRGSFRISERVRTGKISTIYGVGMPYWMRLSGSVYGVHAGYLPGYPASAGCVRLPSAAAQLIFDNTKNGTPVSIYSSWDGA
jgi:lipoprotein-anchoring transpeptidase ErfK/SrfK